MPQDNILDIIQEINNLTGIDLFKLGQVISPLEGFKVSPHAYLQNDLRFIDTVNYCGFTAPTLTANTIWTLPTADGTVGQYLKTDGSSGLGWASIVAGITGSGTINTVPKFTAATVIGDSQITDDGTTVSLTNLTVATNLKNTAMTAGSVPFIGAAGLFSQDNDNLSWSNSNKELIIGSDNALSAANTGIVIHNFDAVPVISLTRNSATAVNAGDETGRISFQAYRGGSTNLVLGYINATEGALTSGGNAGILRIYVGHELSETLAPVLQATTNALLNTLTTLYGTVNFAADLTGFGRIGTMVQPMSLTNGGTGLSTIAAGSILAANTLNALSAITSTSALKVLKNNAGTISWNAVTGTGDSVMATSPTLVTPLLGTPTSGVLTNCTGLPVSTGISGLGANMATFLATPSSANLIATVTDETGTGALVFANTPTLVTPVLGAATATSINKVSITAPATASTLTIADGVTLTVTASTTLSGTPVTNPMTTLGDIIYEDASPAMARLAGNITTTRKFLRQTGNGAISAVPAWDTVTQTDVGLSSVENTALSTWAGTTNITTIGAVTATSINKVSITAPATSATITITDGKTLSVPLDASVSGTNTGDNATNTQYSGLAASKADVGQTFYIGTTQVAINRASAALTLAGITLTTPDIGAATATSIAIGANTLTTAEWAYLDGQNQAVATTSSPTFANLVITATGDIKPSADSTTAINIAQANGTNFVTFDSTNKRIGVNVTPGSPIHLYYTAAELLTSGTTHNSAFRIGSSLANNIDIGLNTATGNYGAYIQAGDNNLVAHYSLHLQPNGGNVGIGIDPTYQLELSTDSAGKPGAGGLWTVVSDERLKDDIVLADLDRCYEIVKSVPLKRFTWKENAYSDEQVKDRSSIGWVANDVQVAFPKSVDTKKFELKDKTIIKDCLDLNGGQMLMAMYGALQKLQNKVELLEKGI